MALLFFEVKSVQEPMRKRRDHQRSDPDESESGEKRVKRSEQFCGRSLKLIDRTHPAENHRRVEQRIDPAQVRDEMVTADSDPQRPTNHKQREQEMLNDAPKELGRGEQLMTLMFVHLNGAVPGVA